MNILVKEFLTGTDHPNIIHKTSYGYSPRGKKLSLTKAAYRFNAFELNQAESAAVRLIYGHDVKEILRYYHPTHFGKDQMSKTDTMYSSMYARRFFNISNSSFINQGKNEDCWEVFITTPSLNLRVKTIIIRQ